jgi:hypothetical protein
VIRRGSTSGTKKESSTDTWFGQMIAPPVSGTFSRPSVCTRQLALNTGVRTARATG